MHEPPQVTVVINRCSCIHYCSVFYIRSTIDHGTGYDQTASAQIRLATDYGTWMYDRRKTQALLMDLSEDALSLAGVSQCNEYMVSRARCLQVIPHCIDHLPAVLFVQRWPSVIYKNNFVERRGFRCTVGCDRSVPACPDNHESTVSHD